jgi:protein-S-isoprenylcysteine O-methyltransferase Ste14
MTALKLLFFTLLGLLVMPGLISWLLLQWSGGAPELTLSIWLIGLLPLLADLGLFFWCNGMFTFIEEPRLARKYGESYRSYLRTVPRWLPRFALP